MSTILAKIDLLRLQGASVRSLNGQNVVVIPCDSNDIYLSVNSDQIATRASLGILIGENRTPGQYGDTHYIKQSLSEQFRQNPNNAALVQAIGDTFLGNGKPLIRQAVAQPVQFDDAPQPTYPPFPPQS